MKIFNKGNKTYEFDATRTFDFARWGDQASNFWLIEGYLDFRGLEEIKQDRIVHLEFEEPNRFFLKDPLFRHEAYEHMLDKIFSICPYTTPWLNHRYGNTKRTLGFIPFNENLVPHGCRKQFDIVYAGHIFAAHTDELVRGVEVMRKFNYRLIAPADYPYTTNPGAKYDEKIRVTAESRISLVHNLLFLGKNEIHSVQDTPGWQDNAAYAQIPPKSLWHRLAHGKEQLRAVVPQVKSRTFDAAFCRSLILCRKDPFNVITHFFTPGTEFLYYEPETLEEQVRDILAHYGEYEPIIDRAYQRAMRDYTTEAFFNKHLKHL